MHTTYPDDAPPHRWGAVTLVTLLALSVGAGCPGDDDDSSGDDDTTVGDDDTTEGDDDTTSGDDDDSAGDDDSADDDDAPELPPQDRLAVYGPRLIDHRGRTVTLRGFNAGGRSRIAPYAPFEYEPGAYDDELDVYLDRVGAWGANVLRVPFSWQGIEPVRGEYDEEYLQRIDALLDGAWERGLWTILVFQQDRYAEPVCGTGFPFWTFQMDDLIDPWYECPGWFDGYTFDDEVRGAFAAFWDDWNGIQTAFFELWTMLAARHGDRPGVIGLELINMPESGFVSDREIWVAGELTAFYNDLIAELRPLLPHTLLLVDVPALDILDGDTSLQPPVGEDLVLVTHHYDPAILFDLVEGGEDPGPTIHAWADLAEAWDWPLMLGGAGVVATEPGVGSAARRYLDPVDERGMHATWWDYSVATELWNFEDLSVVDGAGDPRTPLLDGVVRPYVRALAGTEVGPPSYVLATREFAFEYVPDPDLGDTEIAVPSWIYGAAPEVGCEGASCSLGGGLLTVEPDAGAPTVRISLAPG